MKTKKIWMWAIILGLIATVTLYFALFYHQDGQTENNKTNSTVKEKQESESEPNTSNADATKSTTNTTADTESKAKEDEDSNQKEEEKNEFRKQRLLSIADGKRAISINVDQKQGLEGFIEPGNYVDVVALTPSKEEWNHDDESQMLLQNVKVLAVGHVTDDQQKAASYTAVTLEIGPEDGLRLALAQYDGQLYLMLRNEGDETRITDNIHFHADQLHWGGHLSQ